MNYRILAKMGCRLIAVFYMVTHVGFLPSAVVSIAGMKRNSDPAAVISIAEAFSPMVFVILLCFLLWIYAENISRLMVKGDEPEVPLSEVSYESLRIIAFSFAGVLIAAGALPELLSSATQTILMTSNKIISRGDGNYISLVARITGQVVKLLIGLWLILGARGIVGGIKYLRTAGVRKDSDGE